LPKFHPPKALIANQILPDFANQIKSENDIDLQSLKHQSPKFRRKAIFTVFIWHVRYKVGFPEKTRMKLETFRRAIAMRNNAQIKTSTYGHQSQLVPKVTRPQYLGRKFLKEFCDPDNPGAFRFYEGVVFAREYLPSATPKWQYLLKYTDGDLEHLPSHQVRNLFFVSDTENSENDGLPNQQIESIEVQQDIQKSVSCLTLTDTASTSNAADTSTSKVENVIEPCTRKDGPKIAINLELKDSTLVHNFFRSLLPCSYRVPSPVCDESKSPSLSLIECDVDIEANPSLSVASHEGKRKRDICSLSSVMPLTSARIRNLVAKINYKFSWQLGNMQIQCDKCRKWWKQDCDECGESQKRINFSCSERGKICGVECLVCETHLSACMNMELPEGGVDAILKRAAIISEHAQSFPQCIADPRIFASLVAELEDSLPWRAVSELRPEMWRRFRSTCATAVTYARVGAALIWLVKNLKLEAVHISLLSDLENVVEKLCQIEAGTVPLLEEVQKYQVRDSAKETELARIKKARSCEASALASAVLMFVDQHVLDWVGIEALNRRWEETANGWVVSEVLEQECDFRYIVRSELSGHGLSIQHVAAKMRQADEHWDAPVCCKDCSGSGRNPEAKDEDCSLCLGMGVMGGDSPFKLQLQDGTPTKLCVRFVNEHKGLGVFAKEDIPAGVAVCEYVGEVISTKEAHLREKEYAEKGLFYMFEPRQLTSTMTRWVTDATRVGNVARFINHACHPGGNLVVRHFAASARFSWCDKVRFNLLHYACCQSPTHPSRSPAVDGNRCALELRRLLLTQIICGGRCPCV
jgi:hypothetical protein